MTLTDISIIGTEQVISDSTFISTVVVLSFSVIFFIVSLALLGCDGKKSPYICLAVSVLLLCLGVTIWVVSPATTVYTIEIPDTVPYKEVLEEWDIQEMKYITNDSVICTAERNEEE